MRHSTNIPSYKVNVNNKGQEWVQVSNLVFKLRRISDSVIVDIIDEKEKNSYVAIIDDIIIKDLDHLKFRLNRHVQVTEEQLLVLSDCLINYTLHGTMFKKTKEKKYSVTKKGNKYVETDKYLITVSRYAREIVVKAIAEDDTYIIVMDERDIHDNTKMMNHLDTLKLTVSEFAAVKELVDDVYYDDFGYQGGE